MVLFTLAGAIIGGTLMYIITDKREFNRSGFAPSNGDIKFALGIFVGAGVGFGFGAKFWYDLITN